MFKIMPLMPPQTPPSFKHHLSALQEHYEAILAENESKVSEAKEQLIHINALLENGMQPATAKQTVPPSPKASTP